MFAQSWLTARCVDSGCRSRLGSLWPDRDRLIPRFVTPFPSPRRALVWGVVDAVAKIANLGGAAGAGRGSCSAEHSSVPADRGRGRWNAGSRSPRCSDRPSLRRRPPHDGQGTPVVPGAVTRVVDPPLCSLCMACLCFSAVSIPLLAASRLVSLPVQVGVWWWARCRRALYPSPVPSLVRLSLLAPMLSLFVRFYQPRLARPSTPLLVPPSIGLSRRWASTPRSNARLSRLSRPRP